MCRGRPPACPSLRRGSCRRAWSAFFTCGASGDAPLGSGSLTTMLAQSSLSHCVACCCACGCTVRLTPAPGPACGLHPDLLLSSYLDICKVPEVIVLAAAHGCVCAACHMSLAGRPRSRCECRHPASGYVQGINDLVTPFLAVFLSPHMEGSVGAETATEFPEEVDVVLKPHAADLCVSCCSFG